MAKIGIEDSVYRDPRYKVLGKKMGTTKFDAWGRMCVLWDYCTEKQTYCLRPEHIDELAEFDGFHNFICDASVDLAEKTHEGIRVKGTRGRIEWLGKLIKTKKKAGKIRSRSAKRNTDGTFTSTPSSTDPAPAGNTPPAESSVSVSVFASASVFDFESLYKIYPRKRGKHEGMKRLAKRIRTQSEFDDFANAVKAYRKECLHERTEPKHIKHWSTFVGTDETEPWRDFIPEASPIQQPAPALAIAPRSFAPESAPDVPADPARVAELMSRAFGYQPKAGA